MTTHVQLSARASKQAGLIGVAILLLAGFCFGQAAISLSPASGPPTTNMRISGRGFTPHTKIDLYFDSQDEAVAIADGSGSFSQIALSAPASALPGTHWVSAVERSGLAGSQVAFTVQSDWTEFHKQNMRRWNGVEKTLGVKNVNRLELKWMYAGSGELPVGQSPVVANGAVYFGSYESGQNFYALDANTGVELWSFPTGGVLDTPAVANGVVYFCTFISPALYALNATTGSRMWSLGIDCGQSAPTIVNGVVYVGSEYQRNVVYAVNAATGSELWTYTTAGDMAASPAVFDGVVYVCSSNPDEFYALNASTGALIWTNSSVGCQSSSPTVANGIIYIGSENSNVYALSSSTGATLWSYTTASAVETTPAVANGIVYVGSDDYTVYALNAKSGAFVWSYFTGGVVYSSPAVANGVVYVGSDGYLFALNAKTGAALWIGYADSPNDSPVVANGRIYVTGGFNVYAFGLPNGEEGAGVSSKAPDLGTLHPDLHLKVLQPTANDGISTKNKRSNPGQIEVAP